MLNESIDKPLLNRALRGTYPPGSTYKPFMALAALQPASARPPPSSTTPAPGHVWRPPFRSPDERARRGRWTCTAPSSSPATSYFYSLANEMGVDADARLHEAAGLWPDHRHRHPGRVRGVLPSQEWKRNYYKRPEQQKWYAGETISLGIGQGYNTFTMLQLAQATATLANNGINDRPHLVHCEVVDVVTRERPRDCGPACELQA
jgi:penicillin-binding protein 2